MPYTLNDMATLITTELGVYDDTNVSLCKQFLNKAYIMLWDKYNWRDTQTAFTIFCPANQDSVNYPVTIDRAVSVRAMNVSTAGLPQPAPPGADEPDRPAPDPTYK